ncbi:MAG: hypothetical protein M1825_002037 [Sarcosagium campestre]|nr:MAG: hypothetical protein M1825_002037 [Sarcosagium campestre]
MADPVVEIADDVAQEETPDVEMTAPNNAELIEPTKNGSNTAQSPIASERKSPAAADVRMSFTDYLKSPLVKLSVGSGLARTELTAHKALLEQSPYVASLLGDNPGVCVREGSSILFVSITETLMYKKTYSLDFESEDVDAVGSFLEWLYTGEYFPKKLDTGELEQDDALPSRDDSGEHLLKHARVYTIAHKFKVPDLQRLAHSKIHRIDSTAKAEIQYARFVYSTTSSDDWTIRKPIVQFWAHRSHVLRHEPDIDFKRICLDYPQFGFDVLSLVLDGKEKGKDKDSNAGAGGERSARKRQRMSASVQML